MPTRLIVNADDFGRSAAINQAIMQAHQEGVLTTASLMVNEKSCEEAVRMARQAPSLGVGLHLSLVCGRAALNCVQAPGLVDSKGEFSSGPIQAGARYFFKRDLHSLLRAEIRAQFERFRRTGLILDHVNGHLHMHLHPVVFGILMEEAGALGIQRMRLTRDPLGLNLRLQRGRWGRRISHWLIYLALSSRARPALRRQGIRHTHRVYGLLQDGRVDECFLRGLLPRLPGGDSELYSHPSLDQFKHEYDALVSPEVRALIQRLGIKLIRYQDLKP